MNIWGFMLKIFGWKVKITVPPKAKCVICVAPHTSNLDFFLGLAAYQSLGRKANFLMKKFWFFFPLKYILIFFGGIPVDRKRNSGLTDSIIDLFKHSNYVNLAVTPEGTRSNNSKWKTGFLRISYGARVPIQLGIIDYKNKFITIEKEFMPTGDIESDLKFVKEYYANHKDAARNPKNFAL